MKSEIIHTMIMPHEELRKKKWARKPKIVVVGHLVELVMFVPLPKSLTSRARKLPKVLRDQIEDVRIHYDSIPTNPVCISYGSKKKKKRVPKRRK